MDDSRFDDITKRLAASSRRSLLGIAGAAALAALLGWDDAEAGKGKKKKKKKKKKCKKGAVKCGKACVNLKTNSRHCGQCGNSCGSNACVDGACQGGGCPKDQCGTLCVDLQDDDEHCGSCGNECQGDLTCVNGQCSCADPSDTKCGTACVDVQTDEDHCGTCGNDCDAGQTCVGGGCVENACNPPCTGGRTCKNGTCECPGTLRDCGTSGCKECCQNENLGYCCPPERPACYNDFGREHYKVCGEDGVCRCQDAMPVDCSSPDNPLLFPCQQCCSDQDCADDAFALSQGRTQCDFGTCVCPDETPTLCRVHSSDPPRSHCTNPRTDKTNCSPFSSSCGFACSPPDDPNWECCNGTCAFVRGCLTNSSTSDCQRQHCGACGQSCEGDGVACCEGACVNARAEGNCGFCGLTCSDSGLQCCSGVCKATC